MKNIINSLKNGLFNIGNSTEEILFKLKEMIPILRQIDCSGFVLNCLLKEGQGYLKNLRKDLNLSLLNFLLKHLNEPFSYGQRDRQEEDGQFGFSYPPNPRSYPANWKPDPIYIKSIIRPEIRLSDPINLIITNLSSNSSSSLSEIYQKHLAERLLMVENIEEIDLISKEVAIIKEKCGDAFVSSLNIMINDIIESRNMQGQHHQSNLNVTIISHRYWPEFNSKPLKYPEIILEKLNTISSTFSCRFEDKTIIWRPEMDQVKVSLDFPSGPVLFTCPVEAALLINSFDFPIDSEEEFNLSILMNITGISDKNILKSAATYWLKKRIIKRSSNTTFKFTTEYEICADELDCIDSHLTLTLFDSNDSNVYADDEDDSDSDFLLFQQKYWSIIANMFKTFGQISAERIQSTLKMYSKEYREPLDLLIKFLKSRVKEGILQLNGNRIILYSLMTTT